MAIGSLQNTQFDNFVQFATNQLAGSKMEATLSVSLNAKELERLADLDFSKFNDTEAKKLFSSQTEANKLQKIRNGFPAEYRLNLDNSSCDTNFRATIN